MRTLPDDPRIDTYGQDAGYCNACLNKLDSGHCACTDEEREEAPSLQEQEEDYWHDVGEARFKEELRQ